MAPYLVPASCLLVEKFKMKMLAKDERLIEKDNLQSGYTWRLPMLSSLYTWTRIFFSGVRLCIFILSTLQFLFDGTLLFCNHLN